MSPRKELAWPIFGPSLGGASSRLLRLRRSMICRNSPSGLARQNKLETSESINSSSKARHNLSTLSQRQNKCHNSERLDVKMHGEGPGMSPVISLLGLQKATRYSLGRKGTGSNPLSSWGNATLWATVGTTGVTAELLADVLYCLADPYTTSCKEEIAVSSWSNSEDSVAIFEPLPVWRFPTRRHVERVRSQRLWIIACWSGLGIPRLPASGHFLGMERKQKFKAQTSRFTKISRARRPFHRSRRRLDPPENGALPQGNGIGQGKSS